MTERRHSAIRFICYCALLSFVFLDNGWVVIVRKCCKKVSTPKLVSAEPKNTGDNLNSYISGGYNVTITDENVYVVYIDKNANTDLKVGDEIISIDADANGTISAADVCTAIPQRPYTNAGGMWFSIGVAMYLYSYFDCH